MIDHSELTGRIIGCAMRVHSALGPGLLESAYRVCLAHERKNNGFDTKTELELPVVYQGLRLDAGYRLDILVKQTSSWSSKPSPNWPRSTQRN